MAVKINVIGRLGADSEIREGKNGSKYVTFRLATDEFRNGKNETIWLTVYDYSERGLKMSQYWKKGTMVDVSGVETINVYQSKVNGEWMASRDVRAYNIDFVNGGGSGSTQTTAETTAVSTTPTNSNPQPTTGTFTPPPAVTTPSFAAVSTDVSDDLPF
mgnify:CR=1 FL=1